MHTSVRLIAFLTMVIFVVDPIQAADKPGDGSQPSIETLIAQLGDKSFRVRQAAGKALEERGEAALFELRKVKEIPDEEVRRRIEVLTEKLERLQLLTPKRVTLQMKNVTTAEAINELARQTGYKLQYQGNQQRRITSRVAS